MSHISFSAACCALILAGAVLVAAGRHISTLSLTDFKLREWGSAIACAAIALLFVVVGLAFMHAGVACLRVSGGGN